MTIKVFFKVFLFCFESSHAFHDSFKLASQFSPCEKVDQGLKGTVNKNESLTHIAKGPMGFQYSSILDSKLWSLIGRRGVLDDPVAGDREPTEQGRDDDNKDHLSNVGDIVIMNCILNPNLSGNSSNSDDDACVEDD